ncbi:MAG: hypothetical protein R6V83_11295 [Candidatus Thorarchaeota archaeon]
MEIAHSSIRNILVHLVNSESYWIDEVLEKREVTVFNPTEVSNIEGVTTPFEEKDQKQRNLSNLIEDELQNVGL